MSNEIFQLNYYFFNIFFLNNYLLSVLYIYFAFIPDFADMVYVSHNCTVCTPECEYIRFIAYPPAWSVTVCGCMNYTIVNGNKHFS